HRPRLLELRAEGRRIHQGASRLCGSFRPVCGGAGADGRGRGDAPRPQGELGAEVLPRLRAGENGAERPDLPPDQVHAESHGLPRHREQAHSHHRGGGRPHPPASAGGRRAAEAVGHVRDRRAGARGRRPVRIVQRPRRGSRRRAGAAQGGGVDLRSRHAGRARICPSREALGERKKESPGRRGKVRMAKKIEGSIKPPVPAGQANPPPPIGPALGQRGVNIPEFCKQFNAATQKLEPGSPIPTVITVYSDRSFTFEMRTPPASYLLKKAAKITSGSKEPGRAVAGRATPAPRREIAEIKMKDLNANSVEQAMKIIAGSARSMGLQVQE